MKQRYLDYATYNIWANNRLIDNLLEQDDSIMDQEIVGSFPNIRATILHIWFGEAGWLSRMQGKGWDASIVENFEGDSRALFAEWQKTSQQIVTFIQNADLENKVSFSHKGKDYSIPTHEIIQTVLNHGTYHRGQVVMMLRQLGVDKISQTDYIEWVRIRFDSVNK